MSRQVTNKPKHLADRDAMLSCADPGRRRGHPALSYPPVDAVLLFLQTLHLSVMLAELLPFLGQHTTDVRQPSLQVRQSHPAGGRGEGGVNNYLKLCAQNTAVNRGQSPQRKWSVVMHEIASDVLR